MNATDNPIWSLSSKAVAMESPYTMRFARKDLQDRVDFLRATVAVLGFQLVIRFMILMRLLNF